MGYCICVNLKEYYNCILILACYTAYYNYSGVRTPTLAVGFTNAVFGQASYSQPIHLDDVVCLGNETSLLDCPQSAIGVHDCRHSEDASVDCLGRSPGAYGERKGIEEE